MFTRRHMLGSLALLPFSAHAASIEAVKQEVWGRASQKGVSRKTLDDAFRTVVFDQKIIELSQKQPEFKEGLGDYVQRRVSAKRINNGIAAFKEHRALLKQIEGQYGVPAQILCSFWGMETAYGTFRGEHNVIQSLATLIAAGRRRDFFMAELVFALQILENGDVAPADMKGSWAGAMGQTQFMPSSYMKLAVDFDGDGKRNIWTSLPDAFASTANYVKKTGWVKGLPWGAEIVNGVKPFEGRVWTPAGENAPSFVLTQNFTVIKRYNNADSYALCVGHLADRIAGGKAFSKEWGPGSDGLKHVEREEIQTHLKRLRYDIGDVDGFFGDKTKMAINDVQARLNMAQTGQGSPELLKALRTK